MPIGDGPQQAILTQTGTVPNRVTQTSPQSSSTRLRRILDLRIVCYYWIRRIDAF